MAILSFIGEAMEACATCNNGKGADGKVVNGYDGKNDPKAVTDTKTTYSDGEGAHDTVMIEGPLSEVFTKALNLSLKKHPLQPTQETPTPEQTQEQQIENKQEAKSDLLKQHAPAQIGVGTESEQVDADNLQYMIREFDQHSAEINFVANKFDFLTPNALPKNVKCVATLITVTDMMSPSKVNELLERAANSRTQRVMVVVSDALARSSSTLTEQRLVDMNFTGGEYTSLKNDAGFQLAVEEHFKPIGLHVAFGIEGFFEYLELDWRAKQKK